MNRLKNVIRAQQFDRPLLEYLFAETSKIQALMTHKRVLNILPDYIMATLFYEPSLRTRSSFEAAMYRLKGRVISSENAREYSSAAKGEILIDTIRTVQRYVDIIVLRHYEMGAAEEAAKYCDIPLINAGDGAGQHPTQSLLDLYTIKQKLGNIDGLAIALVGDLENSRTVRSLAYLLAKYKVKKIYFVSHELVRVKDDIKQYLDRHGTPYAEETDLAKVVPLVDAIYQTRIQEERFKGRKKVYQKVFGQYVINAKIMAKLSDSGILLHPFPRKGEITLDVDDDPRAVFFDQIGNGLFIRMALIKMLLAPEAPLE